MTVASRPTLRCLFVSDSGAECNYDLASDGAGVAAHAAAFNASFILLSFPSVLVGIIARRLIYEWDVGTRCYFWETSRTARNTLRIFP